VQRWRMPGERCSPRISIDPKRITCGAQARSGARNTPRHYPKAGKGARMSDLWISVLAAQKTVARTRPADGGRRMRSIIGGIALALLIGAGLFVAAALYG